MAGQVNEKTADTTLNGETTLNGATGLWDLNSVLRKRLERVEVEVLLDRRELARAGLHHLLSSDAADEPTR
jgi:hypothetical protein